MNKKDFFKSTTVKMFVVGLLVIVLIIPLSFVKGLIVERTLRQDSVINEINNKWGNEVLLYGPILRIPYKTYSEKIIYNEATKTSNTEKKVSVQYAYFFPENLQHQIQTEVASLHRNNFESVVYTAYMDVSGSFINPDFSAKNIQQEDIIWEQAIVLINTTNLKGIKDEIHLTLGKNTYNFDSSFDLKKTLNNGLELDVLESAYLKKEDLPLDNNKQFHFKITYNGSERLSFIPIGKTTTVQMNSDWEHPSFSGAYLPDDKTKEISKDGFKADWKVLHINRPFSQIAYKYLPNLSDFAFGVDFISPLDHYQKSERSVKYGYLVIALTFLIFFLIQTMSKIYIHPFQYLMIGLALAMFYTLLISISEHSNFFKAYAIATLAVVTLITSYSKVILKHYKFPILIGGSLSTIYVFIFIIIQLKNYALLVGSIGLFVILAIVMFVSRKIDWNQD